jgi:hypothetical protein
MGDEGKERFPFTVLIFRSQSGGGGKEGGMRDEG